MKLYLQQLPKTEIVHYADTANNPNSPPELLITSSYRKVTLNQGNEHSTFLFPADGIRSVFSISRLARRALRLDKCNVFPLDKLGNELVAIRQSVVYRVERRDETRITPVLKLRQCRNILHQGMAHTPNGKLFIAEYGCNPEQHPIPIYRSDDLGRSWQLIYEVGPKKSKHAHLCAWDPFEKRVWVAIGDYPGQCRIFCSNEDFTDVEEFHDDRQLFRACHLIFREDAVYWIMDSPLETSWLIRLDRKTRKAERLRSFPGPVWFGKELTDGWHVVATAYENGPSVKTNAAHIFVTRDMDHWEELAGYEKDIWPTEYFKDGVIGFADGPQSSDCFFMFCEALKGMDGKAYMCRLQK
jgi:hypothetical protein